MPDAVGVVASVPGPASERAAASSLALPVASLAAWIAGSLYLVAGADERGLLENEVFTAWHLPGYLGVLVIAALFLGAAGRAVRRRRPRSVIPEGYGVSVVGAVMLVLYLPLDVAWAAVFGRPGELLGTLAPPRLWLVVGAMALASGPIRGALEQRAGRPIALRDRLGTTLAIGTAGAAVVFATAAYQPIVEPSGMRVLAGPDEVIDPGPQVRAVRLDGGGDRRVAVGELREPSVSPDGARLVAVSWRPGTTRPTADLVSMSSNGRGQQKITTDGQWKGGAAWSPDGRWLAYAATTFAGVGSPATAPPGPVPAPGPDMAGEPVPFVGEGGDWDIVLLELATGTTRTLFGGPSQEGRPAWSPDGSTIVAYSTRAGTYDLWLVDVATGAETRLTDDPGAEWGATYSPDGRSIAYTSVQDGFARIAVRDLANGDDRIVSEPDAAAWIPAWSPDGRWIAYTGDRTGKAELWALPVAGGEARRLTNTADRFPEMASGAWTPDSAELVYDSRELWPGEEPAGDERAAFAGLALLGLLIGGLTALVALVSSPLPFATTVALCLTFLPLVLARAPGSVPLEPLVAGLTVDGLRLVTRGRGLGTFAIGGFAAAAAVAWVILMYVGLGSVGALAWDADLAATGLVIAALAAFGSAAALASGRRTTG